jgi:stage V sporulation protein SpoVS
MISFKTKQETNPSKLGSAIAYNIKNSDIEVSCTGPNAVNAAIKGCIIAKKYTLNEPFRLTFDLDSEQETDAEGKPFTVVKVIISHTDKEV